MTRRRATARTTRSSYDDRGSSDSEISLSRRTWAALTGAFLIVVLLLALTAVTLISQRQRTVLLNRQLATLVGEATVVLRGTAPLLGAVPSHSSTIKSRADAVAQLVNQTGPLVEQLRATGLPDTLEATGRLVGSLQQQGRLVGTLDNVNALAGAANRAALVSRFTQLLDELPAASALITKLTSLASDAQRLQLIPAAARGLNELPALLRIQTRALRISLATLDTGRSTRNIANRTLTSAENTLAMAQRLLVVAEQTLTHAESLDRKVVGPCRDFFARTSSSGGPRPPEGSVHGTRPLVGALAVGRTSWPCSTFASNAR